MNASQLTPERLLALTEAELRSDVLVPLFRAMQFKGVSETHASGELGKDITMWKSNELGKRINYGVVALAQRIRGSATGSGSAAKVVHQVNQCFGSSYFDPLTLKKQHIDSCWVITSHPLRQETIAAVRAALPVDRRARVTLIGGEELWSLIQEYLKRRTVFDRLRSAHEILAGLAEGYEVSATVGGSQVSITIRESSSEDKPRPALFEFPDTPEGNEARAALERHIRTGEPVTLPGDFARLELPAPLRILLGEFSTWHTVFLPAANAGRTALVDVVAESPTGVTAGLRAIELRVLRAGTKEVQLSNAHQGAACSFDLVIDVAAQAARLSCSFHNLEKVNANQQLEALRFSTALSGGGEIRFIDVSRADLLFSAAVPSSMWQAADQLTLSVVEGLVEIQKRAKVDLRIPKSFSADEAQAVLFLAEVARSGSATSTGGRAVLPVHPTLARRMLADFSARQNISFFMRSIEPQHVEVFGKMLELGRRYTVLQDAFMPESERARVVAELAKASDNGVVHVTIETKGKIRSVYEAWAGEEDRKLHFPPEVQ